MLFGTMSSHLATDRLQQASYNPTLAHEQPTSLWMLPPEIRLMIYAEVINNSQKPRIWHPLLAVSKLVREESAPVIMRHLKISLSYFKDSWIVRLQFSRPLTTKPQSIPWQRFRNSSIAGFLPYIKSMRIYPKTHFSSIWVDVQFERNGPPDMHLTNAGGDGHKLVHRELSEVILKARLARWTAPEAAHRCSAAYVEAKIDELDDIYQQAKMHTRDVYRSIRSG